VCDEESEDDIHVFSTCASARASWQVAGLLSVLTFEVCQQGSAADRVFALCRIEDYNIVGRVATLFWNIWHNRNDKLWNDNVKLPSIVGGLRLILGESGLMSTNCNMVVTSLPYLPFRLDGKN
jgi:hypothetical protein